MSENGCGFGSERCAAVSRAIVSGGVIVLIIMMAGLIYMIIPGYRTWEASAARRTTAIKLATVHSAKGDAEFNAGNFQEALVNYSIASSVDSGNPELAALAARARIAAFAANPSLVDTADMGQVSSDAAIVSANFESDMSNVMVVRAMLKFRESRVDEAVELLDKALELDSESASVHLARAILFRFVPDQVSKVAEEFDAAVAASPENPFIQGMAGQYFLSDENGIEKGLELLKNAVAKVSNLEWMKSAAGALLQRGDNDGAGEILARALLLAPRDFNVLSMAGQQALNVGENQKAVGLLSRAASIRESRDVLFQLGVAYNLLQQYPMALKLLTKVNQNEQDILSVFEYANALAGVGRKEEAAGLYSKLLATPEEGLKGMDARILSTVKERAREAVGRLTGSSK